MSKQIKSSTNPPISQALRTTPLAVRGESTNGRVASAAGADARRRAAGDVGAHRRGEATKQTRPRRRNPEGAWVLLGSAIVHWAKVARPRMRAIAALLVVDRALDTDFVVAPCARPQYPCARPPVPFTTRS